MPAGLLTAAVALLILAGAGCSWSPAQTEIAEETGAAPASDGTTVTRTDDGFYPPTLTVKAGDAVTFKNESSRDMWPASAVHPFHRAYPVGGGCVGSAFDACDQVTPGESWNFTFNVVGTWKYHDHLSPGKTGTIVVE